jgi:hypothetical protein
LSFSGKRDAHYVSARTDDVSSRKTLDIVCVAHRAKTVYSRGPFLVLALLQPLLGSNLQERRICRALVSATEMSMAACWMWPVTSSWILRQGSITLKTSISTHGIKILSHGARYKSRTTQYRRSAALSTRLCESSSIPRSSAAPSGLTVVASPASKSQKFSLDFAADDFDERPR